MVPHGQDCQLASGAPATPVGLRPGALQVGHQDNNVKTGVQGKSKATCCYVRLFFAAAANAARPLSACPLPTMNTFLPLEPVHQPWPLRAPPALRFIFELPQIASALTTASQADHASCARAALSSSSPLLRLVIHSPASHSSTSIVASASSCEDAGCCICA